MARITVCLRNGLPIDHSDADSFVKAFEAWQGGKTWDAALGLSSRVSWRRRERLRRRDNLLRKFRERFYHNVGIRAAAALIAVDARKFQEHRQRNEPKTRVLEDIFALGSGKHGFPTSWKQIIAILEGTFDTHQVSGDPCDHHHESGDAHGRRASREKCR